MNVSYEGIGQWAATFACSGVSEGQAVKVSGNGTVAACEENGGFDGVPETAKPAPWPWAAW